MSLQVTSLFTGLLALMMVPLSIQVSLRRRQLNVAWGDGNDEVLRRRIRTHGNFAEYAPIALIALGLVEFNGSPATLVWLLGAAFLASRVFHAYGMLYASTPTFRAIGMLIQHTACLVSGGWLVVSVVG